MQGAPPRQQLPANGSAALAAARRQGRALIWAALLFGAFVNLLMLTGPLYMLQVYDRVLRARSEETLLALTMIVVFLYAVMAVLDYARGRVMAQVASRLDRALEAQVFAAALGRGGGRSGGLSDLEAVQRLVGAPVMVALLDLPWVPLFLIGISVFHPWLGALAVAGGALLIGLTLFNQAATRTPAGEAAAAAEAAGRIAEALRTESETVRGLGMQDAALARWRAVRGRAHSAGMVAADRAGAFSAGGRALRLFLQSAMLGLGAWLVLRGELTAGAIVAASILLGRALTPVEAAIGQWDLVQRGRAGWRALSALLDEADLAPRRTALPRPEARVEAEGLTLVPPGGRQPTLRMLTFTLGPGQALGVIGPSGAGKSSLARALTGLWPAAAGRLRLGGVPLDHYDPGTLGRLIGYLPQRVSLFDGTIAENIARLDPLATDAAVVEAARKAGAHDAILALPEGYDTRLTSSGGQLSGGQIQRIGLARAFFGDPVLLVLDEPNAHLDNSGGEALNAAIRGFKQAGGAVLIIAHRPAAIRECDLLLTIEDGQARAFGPRDEVLRAAVANQTGLQRAAGPAGVA